MFDPAITIKLNITNGGKIASEYDMVKNSDAIVVHEDRMPTVPLKSIED